MEKKEAFNFYKLSRSQEASFLSIHRQYSQQYLTLISAIFAVSLGGLYQFKNSPLLILVVIVGPLLNILLCRTAIKMCNRFYKRFLEEITIQSKIAPLIGLSDKREEKPENDPLWPFPEDKWYLPDRWLESRKHKLSKDFINEHMNAGSNKYIQLSFNFLLIINILLMIGIIISSFLRLLRIL